MESEELPNMYVWPNVTIITKPVKMRQIGNVTHRLYT
jgi:hypothetical protein